MHQRNISDDQRRQARFGKHLRDGGRRRAKALPTEAIALKGLFDDGIFCPAETVTETATGTNTAISMEQVRRWAVSVAIVAETAKERACSFRKQFLCGGRGDRSFCCDRGSFCDSSLILINCLPGSYF
jgi:hypothetical protein